MNPLDELAEVRRALIHCRRQPECWIIVGAILLLLTAIVVSRVASIVFAPIEAERAILSSGKFQVFKIAQVNIPCRLDGIKIFGYKVLVGSENSWDKYTDGVVCWDLSKLRWEWAFTDQRFTMFNSDPSRP